MSVGLLACTEDPTQLLVVVDSDMAIPEKMVQIQARVRNAQDALLASSDFALVADSSGASSTQFALPLSFGVLRPENELLTKVTVEISALGISSSMGLRPLFSRRAMTGFVEGKTLILPMFLAGNCENVECARGQTCTENGCVSERVDETRLRESRGGSGDLLINGSSAMDGGTDKKDVGPQDANEPLPDAFVSMDAGMTDLKDAATQMPDTGPPPTPGALYLQNTPVTIRWRYSQPAGVFFSESETTVGQYTQCFGQGACTGAYSQSNLQDSACNLGAMIGGSHPANCVNWYGADEFCTWVGGRLPTEAEVEAEATNGGTRVYPWGNTPAASCDNVVMNDSNVGGSGCGVNRPGETCSKPSGKSVSGLCDLSGNVWEWTSTQVGSSRIVRGGSWIDDDQELLKSTARYLSLPVNMSVIDSFRCVRDTAP